MTKEAPKDSAFGMREIGIALLAALVVGGGLFAVGRFAASRELSAVRTELANERSAMATQTAAADARLLAATNRMKLLEARGWLFQAAVDLDRRNFGTANEHVKTAATTLGSIREQTEGLDLTEIRSLETAVEGTNLSLAVNLQMQRQRLLDLAAQMDALMPPPPLPSSR